MKWLLTATFGLLTALVLIVYFDIARTVDRTEALLIDALKEGG